LKFEEKDEEVFPEGKKDEEVKDQDKRRIKEYVK
jgi:hypothetical protein